MDQAAQPSKTRKTSVGGLLAAGTVGVAIGAFGGVELDQRLISPPPAVYFSPQGECESNIVSAINGSSEELLVQSYAFTSTEIRDALIRAAKRLPQGGVTVLVDKDHGGQAGNQFDQIPHLVAAGLNVYIDTSVPWAAHDKVIIIDRRKVITGSFNFTCAAENKNGENLLILSHPEVVKKYRANWQKHRRNAVRLVPPPPR